MRSYCRLSDAELAVNDVAHARQHADAARPFFDEFKATSPSLIVLRELGFCYERMGNVYGRAAVTRSVPLSERDAAAAYSQQWFRKSYDTWSEWNRRGAETPGSEARRHKVERRLDSRDTTEFSRRGDSQEPVR